MAERLLTLLRYVWASPYTLVGLVIGAFGLPFGGRVQTRRGALEFHSGFVRWVLGRLPGGDAVIGLTLGHCILGVTDVALDLCRDHEHVHVRQFERWGPLMGPAYLLASFVAWWRGDDWYRGNRFEREAYGVDDGV